MLNKSIKRFGLVAILIISIMNMGYSQITEKLTKENKSEIINWIEKKLIDHYIFLDTAKVASKYLQTQLADGKYDDALNPDQFTRTLMEELISITEDQHIRIYIEPYSTLAERESSKLQKIETYRNVNFHFKKIEILDGNIGYLRFDRFCDPVNAKQTVVGAMNFLANSKSLIIDLRYNRGGEEKMVELLLSYFFNIPTNYRNIYYRDKDIIEELWTHEFVEGSKLPDNDLYILTSDENTFSAAEDFTYALKCLNRATIIGETTRGGAHTIEDYYFEKYNITFRIPDGRAYDPKTNLDWEGIGVVPDIYIRSKKALDAAYTLALKQRFEKATNQEEKARLKWLYEFQKACFEPISVNTETLKSYAGKYGPLVVKFENNNIFLLEPGSENYSKLYALTDNLFMIDAKSKIRGRFEKNKKGKTVALVGIMANGEERRFPKK